jgi:hypothetical protein
MQQPPSRDEQTIGQLMDWLDRLFGDISAFLIALAIGLAVLDFTCFTALHAVTVVQASATSETAQTAGVAPPIGSAFRPLR